MPQEQNFCKTIYLAEDDEDDICLFMETVKKLHPECNVGISRNGQQLLNNLCSAESSIPDILFLDINMPIKNGLECLKEIRSRSSWNAIKIIIFSTSSSSIHIELAYRLGADFYAVKPVCFQEFKELLQDIFSMDWSSLKRDKTGFLLT